MSAADLQQRVRDVLAILKQETVPPQLQPTVFTLLWDASNATPRESTLSTAHAARSERRVPVGTGPLAALAERIGRPADELADLYTIGADGTPTVSVPSRRLAAAKTRASVDIALLVCAARQAGGEAATPADAIRAVCDHYGKLDGANFATTLKAADHYWQVSGKKGSPANYTLRKPGWDAVADLVGKLVAADPKA